MGDTLEERLLKLWGNDGWFVPRDAWEAMLAEERLHDPIDWENTDHHD